MGRTNFVGRNTCGVVEKGVFAGVGIIKSWSSADRANAAAHIKVVLIALLHQHSFKKNWSDLCDLIELRAYLLHRRFSAQYGINSVAYQCLASNTRIASCSNVDSRCRRT